MELFKQTTINWLGNKWWFISASILIFAIGIAGYFLRGGLSYGIDFTGGTIVLIKCQQLPNFDLIRNALKSDAATPPLIQRYGKPDANTVQVRIQATFAEKQNEKSADREKLMADLRKTLDSEHVGSQQKEFNGVGQDALHSILLGSDPDGLKARGKTTLEIENYYRSLAKSLWDYREKTSGGLVKSLDDLKNVPGTSDAVIAVFKKEYFVGSFAIKGFESIGAIAGADIRRKAGLAVGLSFLGMLVYIGFRFKPIYGVAAIIALIHDVLITVGLFAVTQKEISLTVIAALLTLVGYSVNDTIVIFDRVRENLRLMRKDPLLKILNLSINQTLSRTIMTSGFTFISVLSLFLFGGEVLNGFSFALTVGIIIGTYSSIAIASPIVEWWYQSIENKSKRKVV